VKKKESRSVVWPQVHPAALLLPMMRDDEIEKLANDIKANGLHEPFDIWIDNRAGVELEDPRLQLDGRGRRAALELLGITDPREAPCGSSNMKPIRYFTAAPEVGANVLADPVAYIFSKNFRRRHLTQQQKRDVIAAFIKADPQASNREIAKKLGVSHATVAGVRKEESASNGQIVHLEHRRIERAAAFAQANPDASVTDIAKAANVGRATAQRAKKLVASERSGDVPRWNIATASTTEKQEAPELSEPRGSAKPIDVEQETKKKAEQFRATVRKTFAQWTKEWWTKQWLEEIGIDAMKEIIRDETKAWLGAVAGTGMALNVEVAD
jgi:hypothetical protein